MNHVETSCSYVVTRTHQRLRNPPPQITLTNTWLWQILQHSLITQRIFDCWVGHLNTILARGMGIWTSQSPKCQMPYELPGRGILKLRIYRRITLHSLSRPLPYNLFRFLPGGFYVDSRGYVAESCKKCPNGSYVSFDKKPGKSILDCKACPIGK